MKRFWVVKGPWVWIWFLFMAGKVLGQTPYEEVYIQGHRCMVIEPADLSPDAPVVLMLHGFGTNGFEQLAVYEQLSLPPCLVVLPDAPLSASHGSYGARTWYDRFTHSRKDMEKSRDYLFEVMDHFSKEPTDSSTPGTESHSRPVILMGFSQGAVMSLEAGLNYKGNIEAIVSMSGLIEYPEKTMAHPLAPKKTPILLVQGEWDPIVQSDNQETMKSLRRAGYHPVIEQFPMGHKINRATILAVSNFLENLFEQNHQN